MKSYYDNPAISNSKLNLLEEGPFEYMLNARKEADYFDEGSAVDCILTTPELAESTLMFLPKNIKVPTGKTKEVIRRVVNEKAVTDEEILNILYLEDYQPNWKPETSLNKIKEYEDYLNLYRYAAEEDRIVLSYDQKKTIDSCVSKVLKSPTAGKYFTQSPHFNEDFYTSVETQIPFYWSKNVLDTEIDLKCLMDVVLFNDKEKTIDPVDLKTTGNPPEKFPYSYITYRYFRQAAFYTQALQQKYPEYTVNPFKFVVVSKNDEYEPIVYEVSSFDLSVGIKGGYRANSTSLYRGTDNLLKELVIRRKESNWITPWVTLEQQYEGVESPVVLLSEFNSIYV